MVDSNSTEDRASPGVVILEDLCAAIAGAACLIASGAPTADIDCARRLLLQARERCGTLREIVHG